MSFLKRKLLLIKVTKMIILQILLRQFEFCSSIEVQILIVEHKIIYILIYSRKNELNNKFTLNIYLIMKGKTY